MQNKVAFTELMFDPFYLISQI